MNKMESVRNWLFILVILIATGIVTAVLPLLNLSMNLSIGSGPARPPVEETALIIQVPAPLTGMLGTQIVLSSLQTVGVFVGLLVLAAGSIVVVGLILSLLIRLLSKSVTAVAGSEKYQASVTSLDKKEQEKLKTYRENGAKPNTPEQFAYHMDPVSVSLIALFFVGIIGTLTYSVLFPTGEYTLFGQTFNSSLPILIILFVITVALLAWRLRRQQLLAVAQKDYAPIPWDFIAVLIAGLLIVGIGLGLMLYINTPT